jgi:hypothetical protein
MGTCKECRWWGANLCYSPKNYGPDSGGRDGAESASGMEGIRTGPDFGCVHHEAKVPEGAA